MVDANAIAAAFTGIQTSFNIAKGLLELKTDAKVREKVIQLNSILYEAQQNAFTAQASQFALADEVRELKEKITQFEAWDREKERYDLKRLPPGALIYELKDEASSTAPPHYLCANCFEQRKKSYLQSQGPSMGVEFFHCHTCGEKIRSGTPKRPTVQRTRRDII